MIKKNGKKRYSAEFKTKVAIEALSGLKTLGELSQKYELHPTQVSSWKNQLMKNAVGVFKGDIKSHEKQAEEKTDSLYRQIGQLQVENTWLKKKSGLEP